MSFVLADRVKETTTSPGTGTATLSGAVTGYQSFSAGIGANNTTYYVIADSSGANWEVGYGTVGAGGTTLARTTVLASSNSNSLVDFASGTQYVWCDYAAGKSVIKDSNGDVSNLTGGISTPNYIQFNTGATPTTAPGMVWWDGGTSLNMQMTTNVAGQVCEDNFMYVKASSAISKGNLVMFNGTDGASGHILAVPSTGVTNGQTIIGVAAENISNGNFGLIQILGQLMGLDTSGSSVGETWANGDILYYNSAYTGGLTHTYPTSGPIITVAAVIYAHSGTTGSIVVRPSVTQRLNATSPLSNTQTSSGSSLSISQSSGSTAGYLSSTDWTTFNNKVTSVSGTSPVASSGGATPAISLSSGYGDTQNPYASKTANYVLAAPSGSAGVPSFRAITAADLGTGTASSSNYLRGDLTWAAISSGISVTNDTSTATALYPTFTSATSGSISGVSVTSTKLTFVPSTGALSSTSVAGTSDERLKTNWTQVAPDFLEKLANVKSGIYDRTDVKLTQAGVSAQSLQEVLPEAVLDNGDGYLAVAYGNAALVAAIELAKEVKALRAEVELLKAK